MQNLGMQVFGGVPRVSPGAGALPSLNVLLSPPRMVNPGLEQPWQAGRMQELPVEQMRGSWFGQQSPADLDQHREHKPITLP